MVILIGERPVGHDGQDFSWESVFGTLVFRRGDVKEEDHQMRGDQRRTKTREVTEGYQPKK